MHKKTKNDKAYYKLIRQLEANKRTGIIEELADLYERDHGGCDDSTCTMNYAFMNGYALLACEIWSNSGASCEDFNKLYSKLPKRALNEAIKYETKWFNEDEDCKSVLCQCGAYVCGYEWHGSLIHCSSCDKEFELPKGRIA